MLVPALWADLVLSVCCIGLKLCTHTHTHWHTHTFMQQVSFLPSFRRLFSSNIWKRRFFHDCFFLLRKALAWLLWTMCGTAGTWLVLCSIFSGFVRFCFRVLAKMHGIWMAFGNALADVGAEIKRNFDSYVLSFSLSTTGISYICAIVYLYVYI